MVIERFAVFLVALDPALGAETAKTRPCVIVSPDDVNDALATVIIAPMTTVRRRWPTRPAVTLQGKTGEIALDQPAMDSLRGLRQVIVSPAAHAQEHSLEVQLPFLQTVLSDFKLVPLAVGDASPAEVAEVLEALWGGPETLIIVSSDLSHFLSYNAAQTVDRQTIQRILYLKGPLTQEQACGGTPINGLLQAARHHQLQPRLLGLCNSGDTAGDRGRVVGYASIAFLEPARAPA